MLSAVLKTLRPGKEKYVKTARSLEEIRYMILLDTSIFIYIANGTLDRTIIASSDIACASVSVIEALGYPKIEAREQLILSSILEET
jgi:hypothetical protein